MKNFICPNTAQCPIYKFYQDSVNFLNDNDVSQVDIIEKNDKGYSCFALDAKSSFQPDPSLEGRLNSELPKCGLIELLNNQVRILEKIENIGLGD